MKIPHGDSGTRPVGGLAGLEGRSDVGRDGMKATFGITVNGDETAAFVTRS